MAILEELTRREFLERTLKGAAGIVASASSLSFLEGCASELTKDATEQDILNALRWIEFGKVIRYESNPHGIPVEMPEDAFPIVSDYLSNYTTYGTSRLSNQLGTHTGIDFKAPTGIPVIAVADGYVIRSEDYSDAGGNIVIRHTATRPRNHGSDKSFRPDNLKSFYAHLRNRYVKTGQWVKAGSVIGDVGTSGSLAAGMVPHLHFEIWEHPNPYQQYAHKNPHKYWVDGVGKVTLFDREKNVYERNPLGIVHPLPGRKDVLYFFNQMRTLKKVN